MTVRCTIIGGPGESYADEVRHLQWDEHGMTNDAPRRRTERAITVPPVDIDGPMIEEYGLDVGDSVAWGGHFFTVTDVCAYGVLVTGGDGLDYIHRSQFNGGRAVKVPPKTAFTPTEVEAAKTHGSALYEQAALDCDQARELLAVEEAKAEMEAWRLNNAEWLDWLRDSDHDGMNARAVAAFADEERAWLDTLTPPREGETLGDWVARMPARTPGPFEGREYMQHLFDKLSRNEVVGG